MTDKSIKKEGDPLGDLEDLVRAQVLEALGKFGAKLGHDLNNVLGVIRGSADLIEMKIAKLGLDSSPVERQVTMIRAAVDKAEAITTKIRGFIRPGEIESEELVLSECVASILNELKELGVEIALSLQSDRKVSANHFILARILTGLITNASEAMSKNQDKVVLILLNDCGKEEQLPEKLPLGDYLRLSLVDNGSGISDEIREQIFEPFNTSRVGELGEAMGLSLPMACEYLRKLGGAITISSKLGIGTAVHLYFPALVDKH